MNGLVGRLDHRARRALRFPNLTAIGMVAVSLLGILAQGVGLLPGTQALVLMLAGPAVALSMLRPGWIVLGVLVVPPGLIGVVPNSLLAVLAIVPLGVIALRDWRLDLGARTGAYPLVGLVVLAFAHPTTLAGDGLSFAGGLLRLLLYYAAICLLAHTATRRGDVTVPQVLSALVAGVVLNSLLELGLSGSPGQGPGTLLTYGRSLGNLTVMGLSVVLVRTLRPDHFRGLASHRGWNTVLLALFAGVAGLTLLRAAWLAIAIVAVIVVWRTGNGHWLVLVPLAATLVLAVPVARERVVPATADGAIDLTQYTTGRWRLWSLAVDRVDPRAVAGGGWGTWWSYSPDELFDSSIAFVTRESQDFVFPHNDALLLLVDLGYVGLALFAAFWLHLLVVFRRLLRSRDGPTRTTALALVGVPVMYLITGMVGNGLALRGVAERFFIVAGVAFAMAVVEDRTQAGDGPEGQEAEVGHPAPMVPPAASSTERRKPSSALASPAGPT